MNRSESDNHQHPRVTFDVNRLVLTVHGDRPYEVDLERCTTPAELLDSIFQVSKKLRCDRALAGELLAAIETACRQELGATVQGAFCPGGQPMKVDWVEGTTSKLEYVPKTR